MSRELRYGLITGFITIIWMSLGYYLGWNKSEIGKYAPYLSLLILAIGIYVTILFKRDKDLGGAITFKEAFMTGIAASFVVGAMVGLFLLIYSQYINPDLANQMAKETEDYVKTQPNVTQKQIDDAVEGMKAMYSPFGQLTYGIGTTMLTGAIITLICAAVMRKEKKAI